ncbi:MAG: efflux RND transporter periplasmic adaptor subunit [Candidatus Eisenbacteria sp.]|nr:efflux RND transporter periplasmic adaptor subunit [Candidatus Eisenbacteria bacterium]
MSRGAKVGLWVLVIAVVAVVFGVTGVRRLQKEEVQSIESVQEREGIPVDVVRTETMPVEDWREFVGVAEGYDQVDLMAPFRTRVEKVHAEVGDEVPAGKVIVSLDTYDPARIAMNLRTAETQYETARVDSLRIEELFRSGAVSQQEVDHVRAATEAARAHYRTARRAVELDTPISGIVTAVNVDDGDYAADEQILATVSSYDRVRIRLEVSEAERALIQVGLAVRLRPGRRGMGARGCSSDPSASLDPAEDSLLLRGSVAKAALSADPQTRLFAVEVVVDNVGRVLRPGALVTPEILVASVDDRPVIPPAAVLQHDGREFIYVVDGPEGNRRARLRDIRRGVGNGAFVAVSDGLVSGEWVVVWGQNNLEDGAKVKIHADLTEERFGTWAGRK